MDSSTKFQKEKFHNQQMLLFIFFLLLFVVECFVIIENQCHKKCNRIKKK